MAILGLPPAGSRPGPRTPQRTPRLQVERRPEMTLLVRVIIRALLPVLIVFGVYIVSYGHLTPGGGFQGGMILVGAAMSFYLAFGFNIVRRFREETLHLGEHLGALAYLTTGLLGLAAGGLFLTNVLPRGWPGTLLSGGTVLVLNLVIGLKVLAGTLLVLLVLLEALQKGER
jgi:multicomponent Na+:H+ antiporter subunit B